VAAPELPLPPGWALPLGWLQLRAGTPPQRRKELAESSLEAQPPQ